MSAPTEILFKYAGDNQIFYRKYASVVFSCEDSWPVGVFRAAMIVSIRVEVAARRLTASSDVTKLMNMEAMKTVDVTGVKSRQVDINGHIRWSHL